MDVDANALAEAVARGDRQALARAITVVESRRADDERAADLLLQRLHRPGADTIRVGVCGPPGVGKSTWIDALGTWLTGRGHRVAVLAVDPSSAATGGSILGDKTRMPHLSRDPRAFVRPSPGSGALGGVAPRTREAIALCEGAGYDVVLVETIGVGQSEIAVAGMVDFVLLLLQPDSGDELQAIKRGITEVADAVLIHKADGERRAGAVRTKAHYQHALAVPVLLGSAIAGEGLDEVWQAVTAVVGGDGDAKRARRRQQARRWLDDALHDQLVARFLRQAGSSDSLRAAYAEVEAGGTPPRLLARRLLDRAD
jgi:LAO/AO transport system kinase